MDVPNVELVVQWKATCTLSTLWQRFGRGGQNPALEATAVFLVEKEHFDEIRKKKEETKKRKAAKAATSVPTKRPRTQATSTVLQTSESVDVEGTSDDSADESENKLEEMRRRYLELGNKPGRKSTKRTLEPVMDDFINAGTRKFPCRQLPLNVYFENGRTGWYLPFVEASTHC
jgi:superfamily II DNA/RNA helicase